MILIYKPTYAQELAIILACILYGTVSVTLLRVTADYANSLPFIIAPLCTMITICANIIPSMTAVIPMDGPKLSGPYKIR